MTSEEKRKQALVHILTTYQVETVVDIGAHHGEYASSLRSYGYQGRIVSVEPAPETHSVLTARAQNDPLWHVLPPMAISIRRGTRPFYRSPESDMSSLLPLRDEIKPLLSSAIPIQTLDVAVLDLQTLFQTASIPLEKTFLKLDTQGHDLAIVSNFAHSIPSLTGLQLELSLTPIYETEPEWLEAIAVLKNLGLIPILFIPGYFNRRTARLMAMDGVFVTALIPFP